MTDDNNVRPAHIINDPDVEVGQKSLALCGKKWKVRILWADIPKDSPICRDCVDAALAALTASTNQVQDVGSALLLMQRALNRSIDAALATNDATIMVELTTAFAERREEKAAEKQALADAKALVKESKKGKKKDVERPPVAPEED